MPSQFKPLSVSTLTLLFWLSACSYPSNNAALAIDLQGKVDTSHASGDADSNVIQGGIKNEATLDSSLKVIPGQEKKRNIPLRAEVPKYFFPTGANLTQFHGSTQLPGGQRQPLLPLTPTPEVEQFSGSRAAHVIPPISSYTLTPRTGIMSYGIHHVETPPQQQGVTAYVPGYEISKVTTHKGITSYDPGHPVQQVSLYNGISAWDPSHIAHQIDYATRGLAHGGARYVPGPPAREGVTAYAPGYEAVKVPITTHGTISSYIPGFGASTPTTRSGVTERNPGYQVTITTPRNGVVCWDSRFETSTTSNGLLKNTLGGMWYEPEGVRPEGGQRAHTNELAFKPMFAVPVVDLPGQSLKATALGLPGFHPVAKTEISWGEWYKRVARAVYGRWQNAEVGPGRATVAVTVTRDRMLSGRVVDFTPAPDVQRNAQEETAFKQSALNAVNLVSEFEIPEFPPSADVASVTFDVEMKREVDGPAGFDVASTPASTETTALPETSESKPAEKQDATMKNEEATPSTTAPEPDKKVSKKKKKKSKTD